ncbi:MAG: ABC transporter ATP-binding protein [Anaerolineales bacterium]|nr:ABC transporter ATP-binding protein [Anaerolineales bacterium]
MIRLAKYFKPFILLILLAIVLLFIQANCDLALPDYMSKIVNNGIQQGGVENAVPRAIRQSEMDRLVLFMSAEDKAEVLGDYTLVDENSPDYDRYVQDYPALASEPIYVLNDIDGAEIARLKPVMGRALLVVSFIQQVMADPSKAAAMGQDLGFDLSMIPAGTDLFALLGRLPAAQLSQMTTAINSRFDTMGNSMITQMAVGLVKAEYAALGMDTGRLQNSYIIHTGTLMLLLSLLSGACTLAVSFLSARTAAGLARDLRRNVFTKVESFSSTEFDRFSTASLITRSTNDVTQIQMVVIMMMRMVFYAPIIGIGGVIRAMGKNPTMWWIIAVAVATLLSLILIVYSISLPKFKSIQGLIDRLNLVMRENLSGMMVIRAFNRQEFEQNRFDKANRDLTGIMLFVNRVMVIMMPVMMLVMNGLSLLIIWTGAHQVAQSNMQVGDMMAFLQYTMQIVFAFLMLTMMFIFLPRASVSAGRIADVLETEPVIEDPHNPKRLDEPFKGPIEFRHVSFRYPGAEKDVLHDISFVARPGQTTAFIGSTGSGKSTIVSLIPRFYDVTEGSILVDGTDIRQVTQHDLRDKIGYVPQKGTLFSGTIESNLLYADENASDEALREAADIAQATEFIFATPEGFAAEISQGGANVSGGQKQRLAIARALVKKPPIYIFDDSFSAVDFKTDAALRRALKEKTAASTLLIVTQRVSTIKNAEQIIVLEEGRIVGQGTHQELMRDCETYREIALSQLSKEELA